ncbi:hypothetical protein CYLTODRAFT_425290 [Cylindrobasidium torrendii FP15055 ss-10]|uniref:CxC2-like cysteine cluster KDZ transposase-associated domain-containing protein n=1 Tax=Cylindrobasidium torrendii FP15055 ss-10 TaxID=1314674 RepID=A0A0D7B4B7_9AGAR|nr:hypothetical protein CYLTODRAFT_425290 [Cylindrobasidium torrendii FP15055 ss-10]
MSHNTSKLVDTIYEFPLHTTRSRAKFGSFTIARVIKPVDETFDIGPRLEKVHQAQDRAWFDATDESASVSEPLDHDLGVLDGDSEPLRCPRRFKKRPAAPSSVRPAAPVPTAPALEASTSGSNKRQRASSASSVISASVASPPRKVPRPAERIVEGDNEAEVKGDDNDEFFHRRSRKNFANRQKQREENIASGAWTVEPPAVKPHIARRAQKAMMKAVRTLHDAAGAPVTKSGWIGLVQNIPRFLLDLEGTLAVGGLRLFWWDGIEQIPITDVAGRIVALLGGRPEEKNAVRGNSYREALESFTALLRRLNELFPYHEHRRGPCKERTAGTSFGGGQVKPCILCQRKSEIPYLREILEHEGHQRIAGWSNSLFKAFQPDIHAHGMDLLRSLAQAIPDAAYPWPGAFPEGFWAGQTNNWYVPPEDSDSDDDEDFDDSELELDDDDFDLIGVYPNAHAHANANADEEEQQEEEQQEQDDEQHRLRGQPHQPEGHGHGLPPASDAPQGGRQRCRSSTRRERRWRRHHPGVCWPHTDQGNLAWAWCAITALGNFDPDLGGHLILWDLGLVIRFPPLSTILIQSATLTHSNVTTGPGQERFSNVLFSAGGLFRYAENGNMTDKAWRERVYNRMSAAQQQAWWTMRERRWERALNMMTKI